MKILGFIMAFLVLVLSCLPCADQGMSSGIKDVKHELVKKMKSPESGDEDSCSPFCQCSCCPGFSIAHPLLAYDFSTKHISLLFPPPTSSKQIGIPLPIWQPPQLV
ncbi:DUF6660 family protein [Cnuella takakiae]|uniref:DUF6660 family protein n=1 Tax=Cnuella takakiae TaxID=1302690 RepID=UPI00373FDC95